MARREPVDMMRTLDRDSLNSVSVSETVSAAKNIQNEATNERFVGRRAEVAERLAKA